MKKNIHATALKIKTKGIIILGSSGKGKSDLALRLILNQKAKLIADDRVDIEVSSKKIMASAPKNIQGLLEVRGVGIVSVGFVKKAKINMVVSLDAEKTERMPEPEFYDFSGVKVPLVRINPKEVSAPEKVLAALSLLCGFKKVG